MTGIATRRVVYAGDDLPIHFTWKDAQDVAINVTGYTFEAKLHRGTIVLAEAPGEIVNATGGVIHINFSEEQTASISPAGPNYEVRVRSVDPSGLTETLFVLPLELKR